MNDDGLPHADNCSTLYYRFGGVMPTSVRLDKNTEAVVNRLARKTGKTKSAVIREAIARLASEQSAAPSGASAYELLEPYIGCIKDGPPDLSERTGERFTHLLLEKHYSRE